MFGVILEPTIYSIRDFLTCNFGGIEIILEIALRVT
jgi:hypothetical protein